MQHVCRNPHWPAIILVICTNIYTYTHWKGKCVFYLWIRCLSLFHFRTTKWSWIMHLRTISIFYTSFIFNEPSILWFLMLCLPFLLSIWYMGSHFSPLPKPIRMISPLVLNSFSSRIRMVEDQHARLSHEAKKDYS